MNHKCSPVKSAWRLCWLIRQLTVLVWYKALPGIYFRRIGWGTRIYGTLRFGNVPSNIEVGRDCLLGAGLFLSAGDNAVMRIGDRCSINTGCHIVAVAGIEIGDGTLIGEYVTIRDQSHIFKDPSRSIRDQGFTSSPIRIGRDVWVGRGVFIGPGVAIGDGCIIGANSVVLGSVPAWSIAVGAPVRVVRKRAPLNP